MPRVSIVIPVYNEADHLEECLRRVMASPLDKEVVVVNDASTDGTGDQLAHLQARWPIRVVTHAKNQGKGAALKTGFQAAQGEVLLIQDADLEYHPDDYPAVVGPILRDDADVVMGSRFLFHQPSFFHPDGGDPFITHYLGNLAVIWLTNILYGVRMTDYEGCYKAFARRVVERLPIRANGFEFDNEIVCKALRKGYRIVEVPIRYTPRRYADGKKIQWHDGIRMLWTIVKWRVAPFS